MLRRYKQLFKNFNVDNITSFLKSLDYWQSINLYVSLLQAKSDISFKDAKREAVINYSEPQKLRNLLTEALNSPSPKSK